ncbi:MAG: hypothetical protein IKW83_06725 [Muribaculaceae bacterium]|nr:hypothetical protein [Muribaculaceae bacterium]
MRTYNIFNLIIIAVLVLLSSCSHDEPQVKRRGERQIYVLTSEGHIYDMMGDKIMELPNCEYASEIISDGDDYFVSGKSTKDRVGYWKNGKWNTLHIDFIEDVEHETRGISKWDYYIYLFDYPNILKNSGIFPLEDCEIFQPADKCMSVSNGKCYAVGWDFNNLESGYNNAVLYYEHKGKYAKAILPKTSEDVDAFASTVYAYDTDHTIVGGHVGSEPCIWVDKELQVLPRSFSPPSMEGFSLGHIYSVAQNNGHIYAAGYENDNDGHNVATIWVDGVPQHKLSGKDGVKLSYCDEIISYGDDLYALTFEMFERKSSNGETETGIDILIWMNDRIIAIYNDINVVNFTVV